MENTVKIASDTSSLIIWAAFFGGFAGALFAFLFTLLRDHLKSRFDRHVQHYNGLVKIELYINEVMSRNDHNRHHFLRIEKVMSTNDNKMPIFWGLPTLLPVESGNIHDLLDRSVKYELFKLSLTLNTFNNDIETLTTGFTELRNSRLSGKLVGDVYTGLLKGLTNSIDKHKKGCEMVDQMLIELGANVRLRIRKDRPRKPAFYWRSMTLVELTSHEINEEKQKLSREMEQVSKESRQTLDKFGIHKE